MMQLKKILVVRTDRIGDVVLTLPVAVTLKKHFPGVSVSFLARGYTADVVRQCNAVDEVLILPEKENRKARRALRSYIRSQKYDAAVVASPSPDTALLMFRSAISICIGTGYRWYSFLFNKKIYDHRKRVEYHELEYNIRMLKPLGIDETINPNNVDYGLRSDDNLDQSAKEILRRYTLDINKPVIIIHPGSGGSSIDLPELKFKELVATLYAEQVGNMILTGNEAERKICERIAGNFPLINLAGKLSLLQMMGIIKKSDIFVSNSTGTLHIAAAYRRKVIGFYPKINVCSAERWGPYSSQSRVFKPTIDCADCTREQCEKLQCMNSISIDDVMEEIKRIAASRVIGD